MYILGLPMHNNTLFVHLFLLWLLLDKMLIFNSTYSNAGFHCLICNKVMTQPLTTPCAHNFCKSCLQDTFAGQTFMKDRTCEGGRTLRAKKNIMKCPSCSQDISEYLQNPQVNRSKFFNLGRVTLGLIWDM